MAILDELKFVDTLMALGMVLPKTITVETKTLESGDVIASAGAHGFQVKPDAWTKFCNNVNNDKVDAIAGMMESMYSGVKYIAVEVPETQQEEILPSVVENLTELPDNITDAITQRVSTIISIAGVNMRKIATLINHQIVRVAEDGNIVKDFDAILSFDFEEDESKPFKLFVCFDKIPATYEKETVVEVVRTPMSKEDKTLYLGEHLGAIEQGLTEICDAVNNLYQSKLVSFSNLAIEFAKGLIKGALIVPFLDQTPKFVSFGGVDNWRLFGDLTPNSEACHKLLDQEVEYLVTYLKEYIVPDSVELHGHPNILSIDLQHLGVYARDEHNKVLSGNLEEASAHLQGRWSEGFAELLKLRLAQNDSRHCFYL